MFGWLKQKVINSSTDKMRDELTRFIDTAKGSDGPELGAMVVFAARERIVLTDLNILIPAALDFTIPRHDSLAVRIDTIPIALDRAIKAHQKAGHPERALGTMVWLHSVRALNIGELRYLGRFLWAELQRGFPYIEETVDDLGLFSGVDLPPTIAVDATFIPSGLEPAEAN